MVGRKSAPEDVLILRTYDYVPRMAKRLCRCNKVNNLEIIPDFSSSSNLIMSPDNQTGGGTRRTSFTIVGFEEGGRKPQAKEHRQPLAGKGMEPHRPLEPPERNALCYHPDFSPVRPTSDF